MVKTHNQQMTSFDEFYAELEAEAEAEGPDAVAGRLDNALRAGIGALAELVVSSRCKGLLSRPPHQRRPAQEARARAQVDLCEKACKILHVSSQRSSGRCARRGPPVEPHQARGACGKLDGVMRAKLGGTRLGLVRRSPAAHAGVAAQIGSEAGR